MSLDPRLEARVTQLRRSGSAWMRRTAERIEPADAPRRLRQRVGGRWETIGRQQFDFLVAEGLAPHHEFIEIGCGVLRGGLHYIGHLDTSRYHGIDINPQMIEGARHELAQASLDHKAPQLRVTDTFDIDFGVPLDMGIAVSVFTHVPWNSCYFALAQLGRYLAHGGRFYATYFPGPAGPDRFEPITQKIVAPATHPVTTYADRNPYHYAADDFAHLAELCGLELRVIGDWGHLRGQHMLCFTRP